MLLSLPGVEFLAESDFGWRYQHAPQIDSRQVFFCSSLDSIPVPDRTFEFVLCTEVLEHVPDHERAVDELARVTSPGGWLLITVPTPPALPDAAHVREGYRPAELASMLAHRGYQIVETRFCMHLFFRFLLKNWSRCKPWCPRIFIRALARMDTLIALGPPMDLMILAQMNGTPKTISADSETNATGQLERAEQVL